MKKKLALLCVTLCSYRMLTAQVAPAARSVTGKVICGYQGWFNCAEDGSPVAGWKHWSGRNPAPGRITFEVYPDVSEYPETVLHQTALGDLNNGAPARLFSSWPEATIDLHFKWMQQYGIDGVALQRFLGETRNPALKANRDSITCRIRRAAEKYQRSFYIMYDMSGNDTALFMNDWLHIENDLQVLQSPYYAHQQGKPVICIWGFGFNHRPDTPSESFAMIRWLKNKGYYIIGGVPTNWRTGTVDSYADYGKVYDAFDMLSPWSVGRFGDSTGADRFKERSLVPDLAYCKEHHIDYQPVLFSGFAWSNWNGGKANHIPRNKGAFFWRQLYNVKQLGLNTAYIAMFDEFDEGTNILKMADSYLAVPRDQYFLTSSADGTYLSADFYLRLAGLATRVLKGEAPLTPHVTIPYSAGPVWFRSSLEAGYDALPAFTDSSHCRVVTGEVSKTGRAAIRITGTGSFRAFEVHIPVVATTRLSFWAYPANERSRYVSVDLVATDGSTLHRSGAKDREGKRMQPGTARGTVNTWRETVCDIGQWMAGKTIRQIVISSGSAKDTGDIAAYIDDIAILSD